MPNYQKQHKEFLRRQKVYENKYKNQFYVWLQLVSMSEATAYENGSNNFDLHHDKLEKIYRKLYLDITLNEAEIQWYDFNDTGIKRKDLIDVFAGIFAPNTNDVPINLWRSLLNDFLTVRIAGRIAEVEQTTRKRIATLIERGISQGLGAREVAKTIRDDKDFNKNRSLAIARTETITSANQGKYLAALSSPYVKLKKWLPTNDARTRATHIDMLKRPFVEMEQLFYLDSKRGLEGARYPCDTSLSAENTVNCRCIIIFENKKDENGRLIIKSSLGVKSFESEKLFTTSLKAIDPND